MHVIWAALLVVVDGEFVFEVFKGGVVNHGISLGLGVGLHVEGHGQRGRGRRVRNGVVT
ncbi:hypothetical protein ACVW0I_001302 [Bradyrhizobium sp. LM6.11]